MLDVIRMHRDSLRPIKPENVQPAAGRARESWDTALALGEKYGYKNSQVTVLAPTGTIGFMMDCDTTGVEPDLALVKHKKLVGGGVIKIVNNTVPQALMHLGYSPEETSQIVSYIDRNGSIEGAPGFKPEHLPVFDCSLATAGGTLHRLARPLENDGGRAAVPLRRHQQDHQHARGIHGRRRHAGLHRIVEAGREGRRHLSRQFQGSQPLSAAGAKKDTASSQDRRGGARLPASPVAQQRELFPCAPPPQAAQRAPVHHPQVLHRRPRRLHHGGHVRDGEPGEIFIKMAKEGSTLSGFMDGFALSVSIGLQYGVPLKALVDKFINTRFEPAGFTGHPAIPYAKSVLDYIGAGSAAGSSRPTT
jgi:ribonucleoside-diphosphate reductase alpha chain